MKAEEHLRNNGASVLSWISVLGASMLTMTCFITAACSSGTHQRVLVVYDQQWSRAAGVAALQCAPEIREVCQREARDDEANFLNALTTAFKATPECKGVEFTVDSGADPAKKPAYWRLRVDFRPRSNDQVFTLGAGASTPHIAGNGNADHITKFVCETSKNNGVVMTW